MAPVTDKQLAVLAPYIGNSKPDQRGEMEMYCPLHPDVNRSASLNLKMGAWYCHAACGGGSVRALVDQSEVFVPMSDRTAVRPMTVEGLEQRTVEGVFKTQDELMDDITRWHKRLLDEPKRRRFLYDLRGIELWTIKKAWIGFDGRYFKIPVFSPDRSVWNIRTYDPEPNRDRRKIWSLRGFGRARLYPAGILDRVGEGEPILFCEGEWDTLLALQSGHNAITRTDGAGKPWHAEWNVGFAGLRVYSCHDRDLQGRKGDKVVTGALAGVAESVYQCQLPYRMKRKHGRDISDYLLDSEEPGEAIAKLLKNAKEITNGVNSNSGMRSGRANRGGLAPPALGSA